MSVVLVSPSGNREVYNEKDAEAKLAEGYITDEVWQEQKRMEAEEARQQWLVDPATESERFRMLRQTRDAKISQLDYMFTSDYPLDEEKREALSTYRQELRDLPAQEGAPWDGGGEATPWPVNPLD